MIKRKESVQINREDQSRKVENHGLKSAWF